MTGQRSDAAKYCSVAAPPTLDGLLLFGEPVVIRQMLLQFSRFHHAQIVACDLRVSRDILLISATCVVVNHNTAHLFAAMDLEKQAEEMAEKAGQRFHSVRSTCK